MANEPFVPLTNAQPPLGPVQDFRVLLAGNPEQARAFRPQVAASLSSSSVVPVPSPTCEPRVSLQRDGDRVVAIHIQCSCGQAIDLACVH
jgi:hypothetical protein